MSGEKMKVSDQAAPRDHRIVHRLSQMTAESSLPPDLLEITEPRAEIIRGSGLERYWCFMTDPAQPPPMPVPRSIMEPGDLGWTGALLEESQEERDEILLRLYSLSLQDRIQVRDTLKYTVLNQGRRTDARPEQLEAYAKRVVLQLGYILTSGAMCLRATVHRLPYPDIIFACRFTTERMESAERAREEYQAGPVVKTQPSTMEKLLEALTPEGRAAVDKIGPKRPTLRVYQDAVTFWRIGAKSEYLWSEAQALRDADEVMADHMTAANPGE